MTALAGKMQATNGAATLERPAPGHGGDSSMPEAAFKPCSKCGQPKPLTEFHRDRQAKDGRTNTCKDCANARKREWSQANPKRRREVKRLSNERNRERHLARRALQKAVQRGTVVKPPYCETCGKHVPARELHGHHWDYSKRYDVEWLCRDCHTSVHREDG